MVLPGTVLFLILNYLPMVGILLAFKDMRFTSDNFFLNFWNSRWTFFENFRYLFESPDAFLITRNTLLYNLAFIALGNALAVTLAILLDEIRSRVWGRFYQSALLVPYFLSWIALSYILYAFLNPSLGFINKSILLPLGMPTVSWYGEADVWPGILILMNLIKYTGYNVIIYLAAITAIDGGFYEAAAIDGAKKLKQITSITIPLISPVIIVLVLLGVGRIFNADFGLFFQVPMESGALFDTTNVIDTYVFRALRQTGDLGMASAAGLYQSILGFVCIWIVNSLIKKYDPEKALF